MDKTIINVNCGKAVGSIKESIALPLGVEYEQLQQRVMEKAVDMRRKKDNPIDMVEEDNKVDKLDKRTIIPLPGMAIGQETNMFSPYPQSSKIPYTNGPIWSDY